MNNNIEIKKLHWYCIYLMKLLITGIVMPILTAPWYLVMYVAYVRNSPPPAANEGHEGL